MHREYPVVLSLAGLDPSGGAGLLADAKTLDAMGVHGLGVCTALTYQTHDQVLGMKPLDALAVMDQLEPVLESYPLGAVKVGLAPDLELLARWLGRIREKAGDIPIVWDPVLASSSGFEFHGRPDARALDAVLQQVTLVTPNRGEVERLAGTADEVKWAPRFRPAALLVTSCRIAGLEIADVLWHRSYEAIIPGPLLHGVEVHGSGCVHSSALAARLALGDELDAACRTAREFTVARLRRSASRQAAPRTREHSFAIEAAKRGSR